MRSIHSVFFFRSIFTQFSTSNHNFSQLSLMEISYNIYWWWPNSFWSYWCYHVAWMIKVPTWYGLEVAIVRPRLASAVIMVTGTVLSSDQVDWFAGSGPGLVQSSFFITIILFSCCPFLPLLLQFLTFISDSLIKFNYILIDAAFF